jgi:uncharacterized membrane protein YesL
MNTTFWIIATLAVLSMGALTVLYFVWGISLLVDYAIKELEKED